MPVEHLPEAIERVLEIGARHGLEACSWGHAGDGNLHANFLFAPGGDASVACAEVCTMALELAGTASGEHGLGRLKRGHLERQLSPAALAAHRAVKEALDPEGLLNPQVKLA